MNSLKARIKKKTTHPSICPELSRDLCRSDWNPMNKTWLFFISLPISFRLLEAEMTFPLQSEQHSHSSECQRLKTHLFKKYLTSSSSSSSIIVPSPVSSSSPPSWSKNKNPALLCSALPGFLSLLLTISFSPSFDFIMRILTLDLCTFLSWSGCVLCSWRVSIFNNFKVNVFFVLWYLSHWEN